MEQRSALRMPGFAMSDARTLAEHWQAILGRLEVEVSPHYRSLIEGTHCIRADDAGMVVEAKNGFVCDYLNNQVAIVVKRAVHAVIGEDIPVRFIPAGMGSATPGSPASAHYGTLVGQLNADYTFDSYFIADANRIAASCCRALCDASGPRFSPIVIHGSPGLGKTHLLHAVAADLSRAGDSVACLTAEQYTTGFPDGAAFGQGGGLPADGPPRATAGDR
jgi:chromosomal replication initiator protein